MKVLFIYKSESFMAPIGLCCISAVAKEAGWSTYLSEMNSSDPIQMVREINPDIVAYSSSTGEAKHYLKVNEIIKKESPNVFTIMGGPHPTFFPEMLDNSTLDAICIGEGEGAFADILSAVALQRSTVGIRNIRTHSTVKYAIRKLVEDLDTLPFPDYSLIYDNTDIGKNPLKSFITSRGCPYNCTYCFNHAWKELYRGKGKIVRKHSVEYVLEDIGRVKAQWPLDYVKFYDDIFVYTSNSWLEEFASKYRRRVGLPFFILTRADLLTDDMAKLLKEAGCQAISMSIEAGNDRIRNEMLKRNMSREQIINAHRICEKYDLQTFTNCIVGLPTTTVEHDAESVDLCIECRVTWAEFPIFYPYPKTELGQRTIDMGLYIPDYEKMHTSYQSTSLLNLDDRHKLALKNLSILGPVAAALPWSRNLIINKLIYSKYSRLFILLYYTLKMWIFRTKIYTEQEMNLKTSLQIFVQSLKQEFFRHDQTDDV